MHIILLTCKLLIGLQAGYKCDVFGLCHKTKMFYYLITVPSSHK